MNKTIPLICIICWCSVLVKSAFGQTKPGSAGQPVASYQFAHSVPETEKADSVELWNYYFKVRKSTPGDSGKVLGTLTFWRTKPVPDKQYESLYHKQWAPSISFEVFGIADSAFCKKEALKTMIMSSCVPPHVGGDHFFIGRFCFANFNVCVNCFNAAGGDDFCRPLIQYVINRVDGHKGNTLDDVFKQFIIHNGTPPL